MSLLDDVQSGYVDHQVPVVAVAGHELLAFRSEARVVGYLVYLTFLSAAVPKP